MTTDTIALKTRSLVVKSTEIELETVGVRTEKEEALARILRQEAKHRVRCSL